MNVIDLIKSEFLNFKKYEIIFFTIVLFVICLVSFVLNDNKIALISSICGISYTILAGKGKISCYFIGIIGTLCYSYLAYKNGFYGNLFLYSLYYLPMEIIGIFKWKKHLKKDIREIEKTSLTKKERIIYFSLAIITSIIFTIVLFLLGGKNPFFDSFSTILSILGQLLTVKRCIEQWYIWFIVNFLSLIMWITAYIEGADCMATIIMWSVYIILSIYFLIDWKKDRNDKVRNQIRYIKNKN